MIFGRSTNLWLGLTSALSGAIASTAILAFHTDPVVTGALAGVWQTVLGAAIALVGNQPPTLNVGDPYKVVTPAGVPNATGVATTPPVSVTVATTAAEPVPVPAADDSGPLDPDPASEAGEG